MEIFGCHVPGFFRLQCYAELFQIQGTKAFHFKLGWRDKAHWYGLSLGWFWTLRQWCYWVGLLGRFREIE